MMGIHGDYLKIEVVIWLYTYFCVLDIFFWYLNVGDNPTIIVSK